MWVKLFGLTVLLDQFDRAVNCGQDSPSPLKPGLERRVAVMSPRLPLDVASTAAVEAWDTDVLRNSVVELLVITGSWCKCRNCDKA